MSALADLLRDVTHDLTAEGLGHALVGGLAVSAYADPRFTRDIDLAVAVADDGAAEDVVASLSRTLRPLAFVEHERLDRLAIVRLGSAVRGDEHSTPVVDLMFAFSGIEQEVVQAATPVEVLPGVVVPLCAIGHLIALKVLSTTDRRPVDEQDIVNLLDVADDDDLALARQGIQQITARGGDRGRDLQAVLDDRIARYRGED